MRFKNPVTQLCTSLLLTLTCTAAPLTLIDSMTYASTVITEDTTIAKRLIQVSQHQPPSSSSDTSTPDKIVALPHQAVPPHPSPTVETRKTPLAAGSQIFIAQTTTMASTCTLTALGYNARHDLLGITAGHCGSVGQPVLSSATGNPLIGHVIEVNPELDYLIMNLDQHSVIPKKSLNNFTLTSMEMTPHSNPRIACKMGGTTGLSCGETVVAQKDMQTGQICVLGGDSGAPVAVGTMLIGMVNAHHVFGCLGPESGTTISAILHTMHSSFTLI